MESEYVPWPHEQIRIPETPVSGHYMLIVHDPVEGDDIYAGWDLEQGWSVRFPLPAGRPGTTYHVQVMEDAETSMVLMETRRWGRAEVVFLGMVGK